MRSLSSLSSSIIGAGVEDAKEDMTPEQAAAARAAAERARAREEGEAERVVGAEDAAEAARRAAAEAARQSAAKRAAEQTAEATAAQLTSDGMEYDRLIHAHRSSIARDEGEQARAAAADVAGEAAREEADAAAKRRASVREEEEVRPAHLARVLRLRSTGGEKSLPLCFSHDAPSPLCFPRRRSASGRTAREGIQPLPSIARCALPPQRTAAPDPRPDTSPQHSPPRPRPTNPTPPTRLILPASAQVHYGTPAKLKSEDSAPPALIKVESAVVPHDAGEDLHVPGENDEQPDGWNVRLAPP